MHEPNRRIRRADLYMIIRFLRTVMLHVVTYVAYCILPVVDIRKASEWQRQTNIYLFIYYANNPSRQTRDLKSSTNSKNKLDTKTNKNKQCLVTGMECS